MAYISSFRCTRNANLEIPPDAKAILTEVNFSTTRAGLTWQLLAITMQHEKPELEVKKTELLKTVWLKSDKIRRLNSSQSVPCRKKI